MDGRPEILELVTDRPPSNSSSEKTPTINGVVEGGEHLRLALEALQPLRV